MLFRRSLLCLAINAALPFSLQAGEKTPAPSSVPETEEVVEFNDQFLLNMGSTVDVSRYAQGNPVLPGTYRVKISLDGKNKTTQDVEFKDNGTPRAAPVLRWNSSNKLALIPLCWAIKWQRIIPPVLTLKNPIPTHRLISILPN
jgi:outer membrane usher protein FimD/PapC